MCIVQKEQEQEQQQLSTNSLPSLRSSDTNNNNKKKQQQKGGISSISSIRSYNQNVLEYLCFRIYHLQHKLLSLLLLPISLKLTFIHNKYSQYNP